MSTLHQREHEDGHSSWAGLFFRVYLFSWLDSERVEGLSDFRIALHKMPIISCEAQEALQLLSLHRTRPVFESRDIIWVGVDTT